MCGPVERLTASAIFYSSHGQQSGSGERNRQCGESSIGRLHPELRTVKVLGTAENFFRPSILMSDFIEA